jgi:hypothetical protein
MTKFAKTVVTQLCSFSTMWLERHGIVWIGILCGTLEWVGNKTRRNLICYNYINMVSKAGKNIFFVNYKNVGRHSYVICVSNWWCLDCKHVQRCERTQSLRRRLQMLLMTYISFLISFLLVWKFWLLVTSIGFNSSVFSTFILDCVLLMQEEIRNLH